MLDGLDRPKSVELKGEVDLVTEYDRRAEELIANAIKAATADPRFPPIAPDELDVAKAVELLAAHGAKVAVNYFGSEAAANNIRDKLKVYPLYGASEPPGMQFINVSGKNFNTIVPSDYSFYEKLNTLIQE